MTYQGVTAEFKDSLINLMAGFGVPGRDKAASGASFFQFNPLSQYELESAYRANWLARKLIDIPAQDATRAWRAWQADTNVIEKLEAEETRLDVQCVLKEALILARLYGGAAIIMGIKQGRASQPLNFEKVGKGDLEFIIPVSRWALGTGPLIKDVMDPLYGKPLYFTRNMDVGTELSRDEFQIHPSRVIVLKGMQLPDPVMMGEIWGDPVLQNVQDAVMSATLVTQSIATLVTESKFDIIKIPDLSQNIATAEYQNRLTARFMYANSVKSVINTLLLDKEEEWERINANFTQLPDVLQMYLLIASGAADIPATRMLGQSPAGLQSTGESDVRNYYDRVNSDQTNVLSPALASLDDALIRSALGKRDPSIYYIWNPLWQMPATEKAAVSKLKADVTNLDVMMGLVDAEALRIGRQNQLIEDGVYPGLEQALEDQEQLALESMQSPEEQAAQAEAEKRKEMLAGNAMGNQHPSQQGQQKPGGGSPFQKGGGKPTRDAKPVSAGRLNLRRYRHTRDYDPDHVRQLLGVRSRDEWEESKHPRGQPDNKGKFGPGGGGSSSSETKVTGSTKTQTAPQSKGTATVAKKTDIAQNMGADYQPPDQQIQPTNDIDELYAACKTAEPEFMSTVEEFAQKFGGKVTYPPATSAEPGTRTMKARSSAERKMRDEKVPPEGLKDVLRATVAFDDCVTVRQAVADFVENNDVIRVKDRFLTPMAGYRDLMLNFRTKDGIVTELQFNTHALLEYKFGEGHQLYEERRVLVAKENKSPEEEARIDEIEKTSERGYVEGYNRSGDGCGWQKDC